MNKWQIVGIVGAIIAIIGMFLPWANVSATNPYSGEKITQSVYGYMSIILWIFAILTIVGAAIPKAWGGILAFVFGILGFLDALWNQIGIYGLKSMFESAGYKDISISVGVGGYIIMVGFIIAFIGGILQYISIRKEKKTKVEVPPPPAPPAENTPPESSQ